jgi:hypothetical protein
MSRQDPSQREPMPGEARRVAIADMLRAAGAVTVG